MKIYTKLIMVSITTLICVAVLSGFSIQCGANSEEAVNTMYYQNIESAKSLNIASKDILSFQQDMFAVLAYFFDIM